MRVRIGAASDIGQARERNEDAYLVEAPVFAVADGMGGHRAGDVASSLALETLRDIVESRDWGRLADQVREANRVVFDRSSSDRNLAGMGTTLTAVIAGSNEVRLVHVGDSRAYLVRDGELRLLTEDHTLVQRMVSEGRISPEEADVHPQKSILTRALGVEDSVDVDESSVEVRPGDRLLLCTDGLTGMMREASILEILEGTADPQQAAEKLVEAANRAGGLDNITVLILDFAGGAAETGDTGKVATLGGAAAAAPGAAVPGPAAAGTGGDDTVAIPALAQPTTPKREEPPADDAAPVPEADRSPAEEDRGRAGSDERWTAGRKGSGARRILVWLAVLVVVLGAAYLGLRFYLSNQWYVGVSDQDTVAIFNGIPEEVLGFDLHSLAESTDIPAEDASRLGPWSGLGDGVTAESEAEAQEIVEQIRRDVEAQETTAPAEGGGGP
jgi:PPM family protein phosphatase